MNCAECGAAGQPEGAKFCSECGASLAAPACATCGATLTPNAKFCSECGAAQGGVPARGAPPPAAASRRITSVLFGDLVSFTSLSEARDQEDVRELLTRYFDECRQIIDRYGGTVEKFIGDAVMAVWGVPTAHEDDAERSVRAGLELVNRIEAMGVDLGIPDLAMRVGIVTGEVAVTVGAEAQGMVAGDAVNTAARVQSAAAPGQIWVDETTRLLTSSAISYVDVGSHQLKGKADPVPLWAVRAVVAGVGGAQRADGLEAPLIGRERELRLVKEVFHGAEDSRRPALLVVDGEAGSGKTRLAWEFEKYVDGLTYVARWHNGRCLAYGEGVAYYALAEAIRARLQSLRPDDDPDDDPGTLLDLGLDRYVPDAEERQWIRPRLEALLGISAVGSFAREDLFSAWTTFLQRVGEDEHTVVLVIDDAQHADDSLLQFLEYLLAVGTFPCLVLMLTRPGLLEQSPALATNRRATVLHLEALPDADMERLLDGLVAGLPDDARSSLVARSEGVPLFAVETVRSLIDRDVVVPRAGQYVLADPDSLDLESLGAPASLQALIAARLDTLEPEQRRVVDRASVFGGAFTRDEIAGLSPDVGDVDAVLDALIRLEILRQESSRFSTDLGRYQFVQGAVRQVAYGTLSRHDRKAGHLALVDVLQAEENAAVEHAAVVASHLLEAIDAVPDAPDVPALTGRAIETLQEAAARASALGAPSEAASHLDAALSRCTDEVLGAVIEKELARQLDRSGDEERALHHAAHATETFDRLGDVASAGSAAAVWATALVAKGDFDEASTLATARYDVVRALDDAPEAEMELLRALTNGFVRNGGSELLHYAIEYARLAEYLDDGPAMVDSYNALSVHFVRIGLHGVSHQLLGAAVDVAREIHENRALGRALLNLNADLNPSDVARAQAYGREATRVSAAVGDRTWVSSATINALQADVFRGDWDAALDMIDDDLVQPLEAPFQELVRALILRARGLRWDADTTPPETIEQDPAVRAVHTLVTGLAQAESDPAAGADLAVSGAEQMYAFSGVFDDFCLVFAVATELLKELGDHDRLRAVLDMIDPTRRERPPHGVLSQQLRMQAWLDAHDGKGETVEATLREALNRAEAWGSEPWAAQAQADLATWLTRQGRADDAAPYAEKARATFSRLGADAWSRSFESTLTGSQV
ncbi:adenylate/guanylate cyclase domain-containing protein [Aeromicrobium terrae]|uniref:Guanylate cyclase domain-containing protein n=1 Tax=Aeromicrobium terrae TaxID=2498846 RepID=A0A5C8NJP2_9ACTN|nr:adenylate/guanylate cyclase domain-containing protein [Aeromicrobium terrae]TXL62074.1 hypothetical protein FHP06_05020 [Aeromicrobium terrae]